MFMLIISIYLLDCVIYSATLGVTDDDAKALAMEIEEVEETP